MPDDFRAALETLIAQHPEANPTRTPYWLLAEFVCDCLAAWHTSLEQREAWYGRATGGEPPPADNRS